MMYRKVTIMNYRDRAVVEPFVVARDEEQLFTQLQWDWIIHRDAALSSPLHNSKAEFAFHGGLVDVLPLQRDHILDCESGNEHDLGQSANLTLLLFCQPGLGIVEKKRSHSCCLYGDFISSPEVSTDLSCAVGLKARRICPLAQQ